MDGDGHYTSLMRPISRSQLTTKKTALAATSPQRQQTGSISRDIQFSAQSNHHDLMEGDSRSPLKGDLAMQRYLLAMIIGVGLVAISLWLLNTRPVAAQTQQSSVVYDSEGKMKLPTGFRKWVFV